MENTPAAWSFRAETIENPWTACGWGEESQRDRIQHIVAALAPQPGESLLDFGCGTGEFCRYLPDDIDYLGVDWSEGMLARATIEHPGYRFQSEAVGNYDLIACAGPFNLGDNWSKAETWKTLRWLWTKTRRALAVSLNTYDEPKIQNLAYNDAECRRFAESLTTDWTLRRWREADILLTLGVAPEPN